MMSAIINFLSSTISSALHRPVDGDLDLDRATLIRDVASEIDNESVEAALDESDATLERCRASLAAFEEKERFVGVRLDKYRGLMDRREERIRLLMVELQPSQEDERAMLAEDEKDDLEKNHSRDARERLDSLQTKHVKDQTALRDVQDLHRDLIVEIETMRRRIRELEGKRKDILEKREECQEFLALGDVG